MYYLYNKDIVPRRLGTGLGQVVTWEWPWFMRVDLTTQVGWFMRTFQIDLAGFCQETLCASSAFQQPRVAPLPIFIDGNP